MSQPSVVSESSQADKAYWDANMVKVFVEICVERCLAGDKPNTHFTREGWKRVVNEFNCRTRKSYKQTQLKNKWDNLKKEWRIWEKLVKGETSINWDYVRNTVLADNDWWERKIREDKQCAKFRNQCIQNKEGLTILFGGQVATGKHALNPAANEEPVDFVDPVSSQPQPQPTNPSSDPNYNTNSADNLTSLKPVGSRRRRRSITSTTVSKRSRVMQNKARDRRQREFVMSMANLINVVASRNKAPSREDELKSLKDAFKAIDEMEGLPDEDPLTIFVLSLMESQKNRNFFLKIPKQEWRMKWIKMKWFEKVQRPQVPPYSSHHFGATACGGGCTHNSPGTPHCSLDVYKPIPPMPPVFSSTFDESSGSHSPIAS